MAKTTKQTAIFGVEDWKRIFQTYREADFQSYDFETLKKSFIDYIRATYPESFNDYVESSEFIALLDVVAFMGQSLAFRSDMNARENFIESAERRDSVIKLAEMVSYSPKRNNAASGLLKIFSVTTTESVIDLNGNNLSSVTVDWDDPTNPDWYDQFSTIINAALVDSQRIGRPGASRDVLGTRTEEYSLNVVPGFLPVVAFQSTVDSVAMKFEVVSSTTEGGRIYEPSPRIDGIMNMLYRNDRLGFGSNNTGFFFQFKQGVLQNEDIRLSERVANRVVDINIDGINDSDVWVFEVDELGNLGDQWTRVEGLIDPSAYQRVGNRKFFDISSRTNDQISLIFGDGVFSEIPTGLIRVFIRSSNGLRYVISPTEMQSIALTVSYVSRVGRIETATFTVGLTGSVSNAQARESIDDIRARAPSRFYTGNRMVNGEDYSNFPYTLYNSIIKSKAVNRSSIGLSRFNDLTDVTSKYSSTNVFGADGILYKDFGSESFDFTWTDLIDVANIILNRIEPIVNTKSMRNFYYSEFTPVSVQQNNLRWVQVTTQINETTGYFINYSNDPQSIGEVATDGKKYLRKYALVEFEPPTGFYFDENNRPQPGAFNGNTIWATISAIVGDGSNNNQGALPDGTGPVTINSYVPTNSKPVKIIPVFDSDLPALLEQEITDQIYLYRNFGIGFDTVANQWYVITSSNLAIDAEFSLDNARSTSGEPIDASWLIQITTDGTVFTVKNRTLKYYFGSVSDTRFFFDNGDSVFDPKVGRVINDYVKVINAQNALFPTSTTSVLADIVAQSVEADGFVNDFQVEVSYGDNDSDGVADDPEFFKKIVPANSLVFFQKQEDQQSIERAVPLAPGVVSSAYQTKAQIELAKHEYSAGQIFYTLQEAKFYGLTVTNTNDRVLVERTDFEVFNGIGGLNFQYRHNSPLSRRIDPGSSNIIDVYVVTDGYYSDYINYIRDSTNKTPMPSMPTIDELSIAYMDLAKYKMVSDNLVINSVKFKPLFGEKAPLALQATIKVVKYSNSDVTDSEIKSRVVAAVNEYFSIDKWDFGDSFYFSELSAFLHESVGDIISSAVIVPRDPSKTFGNLYEIRSAPDEIFVSSLTVNDVEVVTALTPSTLRTV